jgi:hypothetical protein
MTSSVESSVISSVDSAIGSAGVSEVDSSVISSATSITDSSTLSTTDSSILSSTGSSPTSQAVLAKYTAVVHTWRAVTVEFPEDSTLVLIFIIEDFEAFFSDPLNNGVYKFVDRALMEKNWVDRNDLIFTWQRTDYEDDYGTASYDEFPITGSHTEATGTLKDLITYLRNNYTP